MTNPPIPGWTAQEQDAQFMLPGAFASKASKFERSIRRRNWFEFGAGSIVIAVFATVAWLTADMASTVMMAAWIAIMIGVFVVMINLARFGSNLQRLPELDCRTHLRGQLARQSTALKSVWLWYLGPLVPGITLLHIARVYEFSAQMGLLDAVIYVTPSALFTVVIFAAVHWLNLRGAARLDAEIDALDRLGQF